jgi:hypothetical protein
MDVFQTLDVQTMHALLRGLKDGTLERPQAEVYLRQRMEIVWDLVSKPLKFPARRRRGDREVPKAA